MKKTDLDHYLEDQKRDPTFAERFKMEGKAWDLAVEIEALREKGQRSCLAESSIRRRVKRSPVQS